RCWPMSATAASTSGTDQPVRRGYIRRCWFVVCLGEPAHRRHEALWLVAGCPAGRQVVSWPAVARRASPGPVSVLGGPGIFPYSRLSRALAAMCQVRQSLARGPEPEAASG